MMAPKALLRAALALVGFLCCLYSPQTVFAADITCGATITTSVTLRANLVCPSPATAGLYITGDDVTVNFDGHSLIGVKTGLVGVFVGANNVTVTNGRITGFQVGASGGGLFRQMTFSENGIAVYSEQSFAFESSSAIGNTSAGLVGANAGVYVNNSRIIGNGGVGIQAANRGGRIFNSVVENNKGYGIYILNQFAEVVGNRISGNDIAFSSPYPGDTAYVATNVFRNSSVFAILGIQVIDGGGNRGNNCGPYILCAPL
jgi:Right handed beta helix region